MTLTNAERQKRFRERRKIERAASARRDEVRAVLAAGGVCCCCGQREMAFLVMLDGNPYCSNCAGPVSRGELCPHQGIRTRLG